MADEVKCKEVKTSPAWMLAVLLAFPILIWAAAWFAKGDPRILGITSWGRQVSFLVVMALMTVFCFVVGKAVTGLWRGLLIDGRNWISLSRFQTVAWTIVVLSAILVAAFGNLAVTDKTQLPNGEPLDFKIPMEIWLVMGISVTSLVGSPLIRNLKKERPASEEETKRTMKTLAAQGQVMENQGQLLVRPCPEQARWSDLFQAEEVGSGAHLDLGKVQNFYFTLILVFAYGQALFMMFGDPSEVVANFPELSGGMAALMAVSHAAYLANKARPQSETAPGEDAVVSTESVRSEIEAQTKQKVTKTGTEPAPVPPTLTNPAPQIR